MGRQGRYIKKDIKEKIKNFFMKMAKKIIKKNECPECGSNNVHFNEEKQQIVCRDCGTIFEELTPDEEKKFEKAHEQK